MSYLCGLMALGSVLPACAVYRKMLHYDVITYFTPDM